MAGISDRVRFFLEDSVPELQELERKRIFTKQEIASIAKKRSGFEYNVNTRTAHPSAYVLYIEYEVNLNALREKRMRRRGARMNVHAGQRRMFFILDRATKRFPGDVGLWMQYLTLARKQKSHERFLQILTNLLRFHSTKPDLWIYAAKYAFEERADMIEARSYMQRGLRFCKKEETLWVEYARLEIIYIVKIMARQQIRRYDWDKSIQDDTEAKNAIDGDDVALPVVMYEDSYHDRSSCRSADEEILKTLDASAALSGNIPIAIFDTAIKQFNMDERFCFHFFDMVLEFSEVPHARIILSHVANKLHEIKPRSPFALIRWIQQPVSGINTTSADFPASLGTSLKRVKTASRSLKFSSGEMTNAQSRRILDQLVLTWILSFVDGDLDPDIRKALLMTFENIWSQYQADVEHQPSESMPHVANMLDQVRTHVPGLAEKTTPWALRVWPHEHKLSLRKAAQSRQQMP